MANKKSRFLRQDCLWQKKNEELPDSAVAEVIVKLVTNPKFAAMMQEKINMKVDTAAIEQEKRQPMEIHIFEERQPNGQWLRSIKLKLPMIEEDFSIRFDNDTQVEK